MTRKKNYKFRLSVQFVIVVIVSSILSIAFLIFVMDNIEPFIWNKLQPKMNDMNKDIVVIESKLKEFSKNESIVIDENGKNEKLDQFLSGFPKYDFQYYYYEGMTRENTSDNEYYQNQDGFSVQTYYIDVEGGGVFIDQYYPGMVNLAGMLFVGCVIFTVLIYLMLIIIFVNHKSKYIKKMTGLLAVLEAGDLSIKMPQKGNDELTQLATHINKMTESLSIQLKKEKENENIKKQLIANLSHDLRTPLTASIGYLSLAEEKFDGLTDEQHRYYIHKALQRTNEVSHLVDQLFDFVLISNQQIKSEFEEVEPSIVCQQYISDSDLFLNQNEQIVHFNLMPSMRKCVMDVKLFQRVFDNLMMNIQKYGIKDKPIEVIGVSEGGMYKVQIINYTEENNPYDLNSLEVNFLERFYTTERITGKSAGLGLAICNEIIKNQGGSMHAMNDGNRFIVTLWIKENQ
ncbi:HAMP domain-containing sensor histidine kinase [Fusibacter bizertensis]